METQRNYYDYHHFGMEYWMQRSAAWPKPGLPAATPGGDFGEGALGLLGPNRSYEEYLDHAANYGPALGVNVSQRGYAYRPADRADQEPQQLLPTQQDPSDARGRRGSRGGGPKMRFQPWKVDTLHSVFQFSKQLITRL